MYELTANEMTFVSGGLVTIGTGESGGVTANINVDATPTSASASLQIIFSDIEDVVYNGAIAVRDAIVDVWDNIQSVTQEMWETASSIAEYIWNWILDLFDSTRSH